MSGHFLYERWLETAENLRNEFALYDCTAGQSRRFGDLLAEVERKKADGPIAFPCGNTPEFVVTLLGAWRRGVVTCALEREQNPPQLGSLPTGCVHAKITSATSGSAKCILFTGEQLAADAANIVSTMGLRPDWPNLACISLSHSYGFSNLVLPLLLYGIPLILAPTPLPEMVLRAAMEHSAITLPAVPALWKAWHEANAIPANTRLAISAGAPLPLALEQQVFKERGLKIHNFYGSSECGGIAYDRSPVPRSDGALAGSAMDHVRLSLSGNRTLVVESDAVGQRYWPQEDPVLHKGRFETTDLAELNGDEVRLVGRLTDLLNIAGRKASPEAIESALRTHPKVEECVVFGVPDPNDDRAEIIVAAVRRDGSVAVSELTSFLSERVPTWQIPRQWWFTDDLRPNSRGKISRAQWKQRFLEKPRRP